MRHYGAESRSENVDHLKNECEYGGFDLEH